MDLKIEKLKLKALDNIAWILFVLFYVSFIILKPAEMWSFDMVKYIIYSAVPLSFIVLAESMCLISGNFDLSVGQMTGLIAMSSAIFLKLHPGFPPYLTFFVAIGIGFLAGSLNGLLVGYGGLNPFLATLGTFMIFSGGTLVAHSTTVLGKNLPGTYLKIGADATWAIVTVIGVILVLWYILERTNLGAQIYAVGNDADTARLMGINVKRTIFTTFAIGGILCGFAAMAYTGFNFAVPITIADGTVFPAFAASIIGGISLFGGRGSITNVFAGALFLGEVKAGLAMFAVSGELREMIMGVLVIVAIALHLFRERVRKKVLSPEI